MSSQDGGRLISALYLAGLVIWLYCNADGVTPDSVRAAIVLGAILTLGYLIVNLWQRHSREKRFTVQAPGRARQSDISDDGGG